MLIYNLVITGLYIYKYEIIKYTIFIVITNKKIKIVSNDSLSVKNVLIECIVFA